MIMLRSTHKRILAEGQAAAREVIGKANAGRDNAEARNATIATASVRREHALMKEIDALRAELATAYVRNARGQMQKYGQPS